MSTGNIFSRPLDSGATSPLGFDSTTASENPLLQNWRDCFPEIIGRSPAMMRTLRDVAKIARSESSVLIYGASGTGKELIASALHRLSQRSSRRFVPLNCSAIPETLLESELFGHEKGAFTGATNRRAGHFEMAQGGTILLDEIGDMPLNLQAKLLRVLQERQFTPLGSSEIKTADVRIIAATNVDLAQAVKEKRFREDLYYRLNVLPITLPSLAERTGDVELLLDHCVQLANLKHSVNQPCFFEPEVLEALSTYSWPGNIRELQNLVERLVVITGGGAIRLKDLPENYRRSSTPMAQETDIFEAAARHIEPIGMMPLAPQRESVHIPDTFGTLPNDGLNLTELIETLENGLIMQALERTNYNKNQAAKLLGLNRTTLVERIKKRKIAPLNLPSKEL